MRYFNWKVEYFEGVWNPDNCETWVMERDERGGFRVSHDPAQRRREVYALLYFSTGPL